MSVLTKGLIIWLLLKCCFTKTFYKSETGNWKIIIVYYIYQDEFNLNSIKSWHTYLKTDKMKSKEYKVKWASSWDFGSCWIFISSQGSHDPLHKDVQSHQRVCWSQIQIKVKVSTLMEARVNIIATSFFTTPLNI